MRRSTLGKLLLLVVLVSLAGLGAFFPKAAHADVYATYYVSPTGSDSNDGLSADTPWATIAHARDVLRTIPGSDQTGDIVVNLMDGTYTQTSTLAFDSQDSGSNGYNIIYQAYNYGTSEQAHPVISGGEQITGWSLYDSSKNIWQASVGDLQTRQLYVNGQRAQRTSGAPPVTLTQTDTGYTASANTMASWRNPSSIDFDFVGQPYGFQETLCGVDSIASDGTITMKQPCWDNIRLDPGSTSPHTLTPTVENAFEMLDSPGEWYLDTSAQTLYYIPRSGEDMSTATVIAPTLETLMSVTGTLDNPVTNLQFKGIAFEYATWLQPGTNVGFADVEADWTVTGNAQTEGQCGLEPGGTCPYGAYDKTPGNVTFSAVQNVRIEGNTFMHLGGSGLDIDGGSQNNVVIGNTFTDISANGIQLGNTDDPNPSDSREINSGNTIQDNYLHDMPVEYRGGVPIFVGYTQNTLIAHNQMDNLPWSGIEFSWGWGYPTSSPNINQNNKIEDNLIFNHMQLLFDGGGIRTLGSQGTSMDNDLLIDGNVVHDQGNEYNAIYTDGGSDYITIQNNVLYNNPNDWGGCRESTNAFGDFLFQNNFWHVTTPQWGCGNPDNTTIQNNTTIGGASDCAAITACQDIVNNAGIESAYQSILNGGGSSDTNVALNKTTYSSSNYSDGYTADKANDGDINSGWSPSADDTSPWWEVDLGQAYTLSQIQLVTRQDIDQPETRQNFTVWASNNGDMSLGHVVLGSYGTPSLPYQSTWTLDVTTTTAYRYIAVVKTTNEYFFIAELRVFGH